MKGKESISGFKLINDRKGIFLVKEEYFERLKSKGLFDINKLSKNNSFKRFSAGRGKPLVVSLDGKNQEKVVIRFYHHGGAFRWLFRSLFFDSKRSIRELILIEKISKLGVPTLKVVAAIASRVFPGIFKHALITIEEKNAKDLLKFLEKEKNLKKKWRVLEEAGRVVRLLHKCNVAHADLHPRNMLVTNDNPPKVLIIDLDQSFMYEKLGTKARVRAFARLERFLIKLSEREGLNFGKRERLRFLKGYYKKFDSTVKHELKLIEKRLERWLPWHRGVWVVERFLTRKQGG